MEKEKESINLSREQFLSVYKLFRSLLDLSADELKKQIPGKDVSVLQLSCLLFQLYNSCGGAERRLLSKD